MYLCHMNYITKIILSVLMLCAYAGCDAQKSVDSTTFTTESYVPKHASGFVIMADKEGNKLLRVTRPWQGDNVEAQTLAIFANEEAAKGYCGQHVVGSAKHIVCMSSSHVAMLSELDRSDAVAGVSGKQYIMNEVVRTNDKVFDVGYDNNLDFEAMLLNGVDLVVLYGISSENRAVTSKLSDMQIPYIYFGDYCEQSPLGKAEWIVAMAEIAGCRGHAEELFGGIVERYESVCNSVIHNDNRPKVMFNLPYQDVWYMPSNDSYMVRLVEDAGGKYIYDNPSSSSVGISLEKAVELVAEADLWLNPGQCTTLDELRASAPIFATMDVVRRGDVYNNNRRRSEGGGSDFWESAIVRPDVVLGDMVEIMQHGNDMYYHQRLN